MKPELQVGDGKAATSSANELGAAAEVRCALSVPMNNNINNNYTFPVRRLGVHLDRLKIARYQ
jgi:hypothetical protein